MVVADYFASRSGQRNDSCAGGSAKTPPAQARSPLKLSRSGGENFRMFLDQIDEPAQHRL